MALPHTIFAFRSFTDVEHPVLVQLRDKAVEDIFEWLGADVVPPQMQHILEQEPDPSEAVIRFARSIGCNPTALRRREPQELKRFKLVVGALLAWGRVFRATDDLLARRIQAAIFSAETEEIFALQENADAFATILGAYGALGADKVFIRHEALIRRIRPWELDLLSWPADDREAALHESSELFDAANRYAHLADEMGALLTSIAPLLDANPDSDDAALLSSVILFRETIHAQLFSTGDGDPTDLVNTFETLLAEAKEAADRIWRAAHRDSADSDPSSAIFESESAIDKAFRFFGFDPNAPPEKSIAKRAFTVQMQKNHPDRFASASPEVQKRQNKLAQEINAQWSVLELWYRGKD